MLNKNYAAVILLQSYSSENAEKIMKFIFGRALDTKSYVANLY